MYLNTSLDFSKDGSPISLLITFDVFKLKLREQANATSVKAY